MAERLTIWLTTKHRPWEQDALEEHIKSQLENSSVKAVTGENS